MSERDIEVFDRRQATSAIVLAAVAAGGAVGASARWFVAWLFTEFSGPRPVEAWPWPTFVVNVIGALAIGLAASRLQRDSLAWAGVVTGVLGGFTTYSAFAVEVDRLADSGRDIVAVAYAVATIVVGVLAVELARASSTRSRP